MNAPTCRHVRSSRSPCSVSAVTSTRASEAAFREPFDESIGQTLGDEGGVIDARRGRIELDVLGAVGGWLDEHERSVVAAMREVVEPGALDTEAGEHRARRQRGERTERRETEPDEENREIGIVEQVDGKRREEGGRLPRWNDRARRALLRGEPGTEAAVGDTDAQRVRVGAEHRARGGPDARRDPGVATVVTGRTAGCEREQTGFLELEPGSQRLHRPGDDLECPRLLAPVDLADHDLGAPCLGLASRQAGDDADRARLGRRRTHQVATPDPLAYDEGDGCGSWDRAGGRPRPPSRSTRCSRSARRCP